ncbi:MAG TPA: protein kinase [Candidatus Acidoferrales bacterium]|nr:protein kinase [Candidatus Acidoferrales bacterium]
MPLAKGFRLGQYELATVIGAGGMGVVYRAHDPRLSRDVAIKVLPETFSKDPVRLRRFEQEARAAARLNDPNILAIYDVGTQDGAPFIVSELLDGSTLRDVMRNGPLPVRKATDYAIQIARGLAAAHEKDIVHRDLKPENVFITRNGRVKILDFGIAKLTHPETSPDAATLSMQTDAGHIVGTVAYMSPEQVKGKHVDSRSDIFTLGTIFYEMLSGRTPFQGESTAEMLGSIVRDDPPDLSTTNPNISPALERIVAHCLEKNLEERFQAVRDIVFALESLSSTSVESAKNVPEAARTRFPLIAIVAVAVVFVLLAAYWAARHFARMSELPDFQQITFNHGVILSARFAPGGNTVLYSANWGGNGLETYSARTDSIGSTQLHLRNSFITSVSHSAEALVVKDMRTILGYSQVGTLARVPITGGTPRPMLNDVQDADWAPDGKNIAVARYVSPRYQLEYPLGHVVYATEAYVSNVRISPDGQRIAFANHDVIGDNGGTVAIYDKNGRKLASSPHYLSVTGLAWSHNGREVWFSGTGGLHAIGVNGKFRDLIRLPGDAQLYDIDENGDVLMDDGTDRSCTVAFGPGQSSERDISVGDWSAGPSITPDGRYVLFNEQGHVGGPEYSVYLRSTDGSPAVRISPGQPVALSDDAKWALVSSLDGSQYTLVPTGPGEPRPLQKGNLRIDIFGSFLPDGKRVAFVAAEPGHGNRLYVQDLNGGNPRPISPEGVRGDAVTPDGKYIAATSEDGSGAALYPIDGGSPKAVHGVQPRENVVAFSSGRVGYVADTSQVPARLYRVDFQTGKRELFKTVAPADVAGIQDLEPLKVTPDGKYYVYSYERHVADLYIVRNLH